MQTPQALSMRLEAYLIQLNEVRVRWQEWLQRTAEAAARGDTDNLLALQSQAELLGQELTEVYDNRAELILQGKQLGWSISSLRSLAERLPVWDKPRFRASFARAKTQLAQLHRVHLATWVLLNQSTQHCYEVMQLLAVGSSDPSVYGTADSTRVQEGGRLLDASV